MKSELIRSYCANRSISNLSKASPNISLRFNCSSKSYDLETVIDNDFSPAKINSGGNEKLSNLNTNTRSSPKDEIRNQEGSVSLSAANFAKVLPVFAWISNYTLDKLMADIVAGITIGLTVLPQGLAYAMLAGIPPQYGLYSSFVGCFTYIFFGSTKSITIGPTAVLGIMTLSYSAGKPTEYAVLLSFLTGIVTLGMGIFRLGFIVNFISVPVNSAFASAAAITICSTQVKDLLGLGYHAEGFVSIVSRTIENFSQVKLNDTILSGLCIVILLFFQRIPNMASGIQETNPKLYKGLWLVSVARNAIVIVVCTIVFTLLGSNEIPVNVEGNITSGLPPFRLPPVYFSDPVSNITYSIGKLLKEDRSALIILPLLAILEHITIALKFAGTSRIDASQEMISIGVANLLGSCFSSMVVTGSFSRTTVNHASGVQTPLGGFFTGIMVLLSLQFLLPYFYYIPKSSLAAVIICAVMNMVEFPLLCSMWKTKRMDLVPWILTFLVSLLVGLEFGILTGLLISIIFLLYYAARPGVRVCKCETQTGTQFIMVCPDRSLVFPALDYTRYIIMKAGHVWGKGYLPVVINGGNIQYADFTAAVGIRDLCDLYRQKGQELILWGMKPSIMRILAQVMEDARMPFKYCCTEAELEELLHANTNQIKVNNSRRKALTGRFSIQSGSV